MSECDRDVFFKGKALALLDGRIESVNALVKEATKISGVKMDWYYSGGRAVVKYLGTPAHRMLALAALQPLLEASAEVQLLKWLDE